MSAQIVDPSLRPADPNATSPRQRRVGFAALVVGFVIILIGGFWPTLAQRFFIAGSLLVVVSLLFLGRRFCDSQSDHDIRKLYGDHQPW